jgi:predicted ATPase
VELDGPGKRDLHALLYGQDPKASALSWLAMDLWVLGYPDQALARAREALAFVESGSNPFALARALAGKGFVHVFRREPQPVDGPLGAAIALCVEQGFTYFRAVVSTFQATNLGLLGRPDEAVVLLRESIERLRDIGSELLLTVILGNLADLHLARREYEEGLAAVADGLALVERNGEHWGEPELYRQRGELILAAGSDGQAEAEACFLRAVGAARTRHARAYELRATISLARLWRAQDKHADARAALRAIYASFTEGLDTADLKDAAALLRELG